MSSSMIAKAAALKPEIRLAQSVSEFEASLSDEHKATFRSYRSQSLNKPVDPSDVMRLTAEIDRRAVQQNGGGQCFGPRLTNILQAVQQYAALGDVIIGGSQNIIACGIWSLLRLTLLALVSFSSYMEKLSKLLMVAGRKAPRYEQMALLYPRSSDLQSNLSEYFIVVVQLCRLLYKSTHKTTLGSYFSFLSDLDLKDHETSLQLWADCIKDEVTLLTARKITEQSTFLGILSKNSNYQSHREQLRTRFRVLEACSTYDHQTTWKEIRKRGNSTILFQLDQYQEWKAITAASSTLLCTGKLGFGKSVLLANMVDELNLSTKSTDTAVIYFFCRHDIQESLQARTIIGSIIRQLFNANLSQVPDEFTDTTSVSNLDDLLEFVLSIISGDTEAFLVLDGIDECNDHERDMTMRSLKQLQEAFTFKICCSFRSDLHLEGALQSADTLLRRKITQLPEENPDISIFVTAELKRCVESGRLCVRDPTLLSEIQHVLVDRAQGMFLWTVLQIVSLCTAPSDEAIREALEELPEGLPETFSRILKKCRVPGGKYQKLIFQLCMVARRPLTTEELREALSVVPYNTEWNPARLINDIFSVLPCCGSLITIDEEDLTVRLLHHSVKQYLLGEFELVDNPILTLEDAHQTMGKIVATYLNYNTFENSLSTTVFSQMMAQDMPSNIVKSALRHPTPVRKVALSMFKRRRSYQHDLRDTLIRARSATSQIMQFEFYAYAQAYWLWHVQWVYLCQDKRASDLVMTLLKKGRVNISDKDDNGETLLFRAVESASTGVVNSLLDYGSDIHNMNVDGSTALHLAVQREETSIISLLLDHGAKIEEVDLNGMTPLLVAASGGHQAAVEYLIKSGANIEAQNSDGMTPLLIAASGGHQTAMEHLIKSGANIEAQNVDGMTALSLAACEGSVGPVTYLVRNGANVSHRNKDQHRPLSLAASEGHQEAVIILMGSISDEDLVAKDEKGRTAASRAACQGHRTILRFLLDRGADIETRDNDARTPLLLSARAGHALVVDLLLNRGACITATDRDHWTALHWSAYQGHEGVTQKLLQRDVHTEVKAKDAWTPLLLATARGHQTIVVALILRGANVKAEDKHGRLAIQIADMEGHETIKLLLLQELKHIIASPQDQLIDATTEPNRRSDISPEMLSPKLDLFWAAENGYDSLVTLLLERGAHIEGQDKHGATPLLRAISNEKYSTVKLLHSSGASIHAKTTDGKTALHLSAERRHSTLTQYFLSRRVDIHASSSHGKTALHIAAERGDRDTVQLLLSHRARSGDRTPDGKTALHLAAEKGHVHVVYCLLDNGADMEAETPDGKTALSLATEHVKYAVVQYLLERGA